MALTVPCLTTFYVYLTSGCNCACRHCWIVPERLDVQEPRQMLELRLLRRAIEEGLPLGLTSLKWTGGEPTLHPGFYDFLNLQQEFGLNAFLETNGMLVENRMAEKMMSAGVTGVSVSLDGACAETHDSIRGTAGGFVRTLKGIQALVDVGYRPQLILTLQRSNRAQFMDYLALARQLGAGTVKVNILQPILRGAELHTSGDNLEISEILDFATAIYETDAKDLVIPVYLDLPMAFRPLSEMLLDENFGVCNILGVLGILPRGDYALCGIGQHITKLKMGRVIDQRLADVWQKHSVLQNLRANLPTGLQGVCRSCLMKAACRGSCVAANYHVSGDLLAPFWFCQQAANLGLFPAERLRIGDIVNNR